MTIELKLFIGLLLAFVGDYVLQNDYLANEKTKRFLPAFIHATIYSLPFLAVCWSKWWLVIWITHFFIDRYRLAVYWLKLVNWNWGRIKITLKTGRGCMRKRWRRRRIII